MRNQLKTRRQKGEVRDGRGVDMPKWSVKREYREYVTLIGRQVDAKEAMEWLHDEEFTISQCGPYSDAEMWPKVDPDRFKFIAHRDTEEIEWSDR